MIQRLLILSTSHITESTDTYLGLEVGDSVNGGRTRYGYFLYCEAEPQPDQYPPDLIQVFAHARSLGAEYIYLDRDASQLDELPSYDW